MINDKSKVIVEFFEPPMCCSTGLCGPSLDENLVQLSSDIEILKGKYPDIAIERYMLTQQPLKFKDNKNVYQLIKDQGKTVLPVTTVNGEVIQTEKYPALAELEKRITEVFHEN